MKQVKTNRRRGFTLLEIMLVLGVLVLLFALLVPNLVRTGEAAKEDLCEAMVGSTSPLSSSIEQFHLRIGEYPRILVDLYQKPDWLSETVTAKWYQFVKEPKFTDPWGHELVYKGGDDADVNKDGFDLICIGKDGKEGTEDDKPNFKKQ